MAEEISVPLPPVTDVVEEMIAPDQVFRAAASTGAASLERHGALRTEALCLNTVRVSQSPSSEPAKSPLKVAAWNLERCKFVEETAEVLRQIAPDICLFTEMDLGMARSGNRDTTADLASALGLGHVFGVEFIELGKGDAREQAEHADTDNLHGLHGNAVLTRYPVDRAVLLPLDNDGFWYTNDAGSDQRRIGGRMAIAVRHLEPKPFWMISVHYESRLGPEERSRETDVLLSHVAGLCGADPVLIGGDFNCKGLQEAGLTQEQILASPQQAEPMFARFLEAGFSWQSCNTAEGTTRNHPWTADEHRPLKKIDWFFARGFSCSGPQVVPAVSDAGKNLSDHEAILVTVSL